MEKQATKKPEQVQPNGQEEDDQEEEEVVAPHPRGARPRPTYPKRNAFTNGKLRLVLDRFARRLFMYQRKFELMGMRGFNTDGFAFKENEAEEKKEQVDLETALQASKDDMNDEDFFSLCASREAKIDKMLNDPNLAIEEKWLDKLVTDMAFRKAANEYEHTHRSGIWTGIKGVDH